MPKRKRDQNAVSRDFCFTVNTYTKKDEEQLKSLFDNNICRYVIYGYEHLLSEDKTPHLQGYCELSTGNTARPTGMHKYVPRAHFESRCGSRTQARNYCIKECKEPIEYGTWKPDYQGTRNDLLAVRNEIQEGKSDRHIATNHFDSWVRYRRSFSVYRELIHINDSHIEPEPRRRWKTEVIVYWSFNSGTGKTRRAWEEHPYLNSMTYENSFWSPYNGEKVVLWDDFEPTCMPRQQFLQLTDRYPLKLRQIGGWTEWKPRILIITSNTPPDMWYGGDVAVTRRLDQIEEVSA